MSAASDYLEFGLLRHVFRAATFSKPTTVAVALLNTVPTDADTTLAGKEVPNSNGYARVDLGAPADADWTEGAAGTGALSNTAAITFGPCVTATWNTINAVALCDSATFNGGNMLCWAVISPGKLVNVGDSVTFAIGDLDLTLA